MAAANKFTVCQFVLEKCPFGSPGLADTCVASFCQGIPYGFGSCATVLTGTPANCCSESDPATCIAAFQAANGYANADDACLQIEYEVVACEHEVADFTSETYAEQAKCLCYDANGNFAPDVWDGNAASCVATGQSTHPTVYANLMAHNGAAVTLCAANGGSGSGGGSGSAAATAAPSAAATPAAGSGATSASPAAATPSAAGTEAGSGSTSAENVPSTTAAVVATTAGAGTTPTSSSTSAAVTTSSPKASGGRVNYVEMKWLLAGVGIFLPGLIIGAL